MTSKVLDQSVLGSASLYAKRSFSSVLALGGQQIIVFALIVVLALGVQIYQPAFLSGRSLDNMARVASIYGTSALGMTIVIITGGIDLSVGSMIALGGALGAGLLGTAYGAVNPVHFPPIVAMILAVAITSAAGAANGVAVAKLGIAPFVVTLGTMTVVRGLTFIYSDFTVGTVPGSPITFSDGLFDWIGSGWVGPMPSSAAVFVVLAVALALTLRVTAFGRSVYAIGGDVEIARLAGINTGAVLVIVYTLAAALASVSGLVLAGRLSSVSPLMAVGYELNIITIVVVGGGSLSGGRGTILGTVLATVLVTMLDSSLDMTNVPSFYQYLVRGTVLLAAVVLDQWYRRKQAAAGVLR
jgi:ribose/xylose/arabinose/galactoside ABC-type transport system permease subunit